MNETTKQLKGFYRIEHRKADGTLLSDQTVQNIFTNAGKAQMALLAGDPTAVPFTYIAVGTSATAVSASDTTLTAEITDTGLARASGTVTRITTSVTNDTYQISKVFTATGTKTVNEVGVFNASSSGTMLSHALTGTKAMQNTDTLTITYTLKFE